MKKLISGLLTFIALLDVHSVKAQTADEVVDKYITAMGGKEKLMSLKSVRMTGSLSVQGIEVGITVIVLNGVGSRNEFSVPGMGEGFQIINTKKGWNFMPFQGQTAPEEVSQEQLKSSQGLLDLQGVLFNYKEKSSTVELLGKEKVESADCYKLKLTNKLGKVYTLLIDVATGYRVKSITKVQTPGGEEDAETTYGDFKKTDDGYIFPFSQTNARGTIVFSSIEVNKPVDEKIFTAN